VVVLGVDATDGAPGVGTCVELEGLMHVLDDGDASGLAQGRGVPR
jgi:hypothetical protein